MTRIALASAALGLMAAPALAQSGAVGGRPVEPAEQQLPEPSAANVRVDGAIVKPERIDPDLSSLRVPEGYRISIFADGLGNARMMEVAEDGTVYLTRRTEGDVQMLRDTNGDGVSDMRRTVARRPLMHGLELDGQTAYMLAGSSIYRAAILEDGGFGPLEEIVGDLPDTGQHSAREINKGPDGMFYVSIGSTCNACDESSPESAALLRMRADGSLRTIWASGLRHMVGYDWHPRTMQLWGLDHGIDWLGDRQQIEELNLVEQGKTYGWPYIYGMGGWNPQDEPPGDLTMEDWDRMSVRPVMGYDPHAAPMQMVFYRSAMFPAGEQGNAFAAMRGSWNRSDPVGYEVVRLRFGPDGQPTAFEPFVTGFLQRDRPEGVAHSGRPVGVAVAQDGALLFSDDVNGVIYRVSYEGPDRAGLPLPEPRMAEPIPLEPRPHGSALALARAETQAQGTLELDAGDFRSGGTIPMTFSAYGQDISPSLTMAGVPEGTQTLALLMEDPDAGGATPFVHWVAWNIAPSLSALPEAVPTVPQVPDLMNLRQGRNTRGSIGYFGPRPPIGERPHHYHFQLFALDTVLGLVPGSSREDLLVAMAGHVLAKGELVGTYGQESPPPQ
jgi:Raf kinase inhibitor-like YbhB/YbcL family protein